MNKKYVYRICLNVVYKTQCFQISIRVTVGECLLICELNIITCVCVFILHAYGCICVHMDVYCIMSICMYINLL